MERLAHLIEQNTDAITRRWIEMSQRAASARGLSAPELENMIRAFLVAIAGGGSSVAQLCDQLENHLASRIRQGFDLAELVEEILALEQAIVSTVSSDAEVDQSDWHELSSAVQRSLVLVTELFQQHMRHDEQSEKRYMRLIQSVADESLRAPEEHPRAQLGRLIELVMEAMDAQTAALLVYEPETERLITKASVGLAHEAVEDFASSIDPTTLGGHIASREEPTALTDVATTELTVSESLRHSGVHSLLGVRLPRYRTLFGVLYVGLRDRRPFTVRERRRLEALAERLTLHLDNATLYAELRKNVADLQLERDLRERFVAILAHDLRGPLATAKIGAQMLVRHPEQLDGRRGLASRIERNLELMDNMVRDLLDRAESWGLGLALVRACAEAHGGTVSVRSEPDTGTTFVIDLPLDSTPFQQLVHPANQRA